jgi:hypothetical protein
MLTIRSAQLEAFRQHHLQKFEDEMVEHLKKFSAQHCRVAGESAVRRMIRIGIGNARKYGFTNRGPVRFYIELMFAFGSGVDTDPQYPWANAVLNDSDISDQKSRADRLWGQMRNYFDRVFGPRQEYGHAALQRLKRVRPEDIVRPEIPLEESMFLALSGVYPEKCAYLGEPAVRGVVRNGFAVAQDFGLVTGTGRAVVVALVFASGHRFMEDPLWGWATKRMGDPRFPEPEARARRLYSQAMLYLEHATAGLQGH